MPTGFLCVSPQNDEDHRGAVNDFHDVMEDYRDVVNDYHDVMGDYASEMDDDDVPSFSHATVLLPLGIIPMFVRLK